MGRARTKWLVAGGIVVLLAALYAAGGYWLAPGMLRDALEQAVARRGLTLAVDQVRTNPFALSLRLAGVEVSGPDGGLVASARQVDVDIAWNSLWSDAWMVQHASVASPYLKIVHGEAGIENPISGTASQQGTASPTVVRVRRFSANDGAIDVVATPDGDKPAELRLLGVEFEVENLSTDAGEGRYSLSARAEAGGTVSSGGTFSLAPVAAQGQVRIEAVPFASITPFMPSVARTLQGEASAQGAYAFSDGRVTLTELAAQASGSYQGVKVDALEVHVPRATFPSEEPVVLSARAQLQPQGQLAVQGTIQPQPFRADVKLDAARVPVGLVQRFISAPLGFRIAGGDASARGKLRVASKGVRYEGSAELHGLRLHERDSGRLLFAVAHARTDELAFASAERTLRIGELELRQPQGRLEIEGDGSVNVVEAFRGRGEAGGAPLEIAVQRTRIEEGALDFADRSLQTPFDVSIAGLSGTLSGFSTQAGDPALVALAGRVGEYGSARIRGTINLAQPKSLANISAQFRNLDLAQLTPYAVKFAGYRIRSGRVSADLRYRVNEGRLTGQNQLVFNEVVLGEKVQSAGAADLPLELAVALLSDARGRITLDIPVRGNLNDPQFDFGGLVARALGNAIGKIVSAPFRALASVFGGKDGDAGLGEVHFGPGVAALSPPQEENVAKLAKALQARPQLGVTVRGGYDPERDPMALRRDSVRREIMRRAGYKAPGSLDFSDPKTLRAAEALYLERIGKRADLQALRDSAPQYGRALVDLLAYVLPDDAVNAERLARERAETVRKALVGLGVDAGRIAIDAPAEQPAAKDGIATVIALEATQASAATGGTRQR